MKEVKPFKTQYCPFYNECKECTEEMQSTIACNKGRNAYAILNYNLCNLPHNWYENYVNKELEVGKDERKHAFLNGISEDIVNWIDEGNNLYIYSKFIGNGKTTWAIKLAYKAILELSEYESVYNTSYNEMCPVVYVNVDDFLFMNKQSISTGDKSIIDLQRRIKQAKLVVWDDMGTTKLSDYDYRLIYILVNERVSKELSNIFTSNVIDDELIENVGIRLYSRILETSDIVEFTNHSFRKPKSRRRI